MLLLCYHPERFITALARGDRKELGLRWVAYLGGVLDLVDDLGNQGPDLVGEGPVLEEGVLVVVAPDLPQQEQRGRHDVLALCGHRHVPRCGYCLVSRWSTSIAPGGYHTSNMLTTLLL